MKSRWSLPRGHDAAMLATAVLVGIAYVALAFANGGYSHELIAAVTLAEWWIVLLALVTRLGPARAVPSAAIAAGLCLAALGALSALSMIWANDAERAFTEVIRVGGYLGLFALVVIVSGRTGARPWLLGLAGALLVVVLASLASRLDPTLFGGGDRPLFAQLPLADGRLSYPVGYWNGLGACLALGVALFAWLGTEIRNAVGRAAVTAALPLFGLALFLTSSRGGYLAAAVAALVLLVLLRRRLELIWTLLLGAMGAVVLSVMANQRGDLLHGLSNPAAYSQGRVMAVASVVCVLLVALARYFGDPVLARTALSRISPRVLIAAPVAAAVVAVVVVILVIGPADASHQFVDSNDIAGAGAGHLTSTTGSGRYHFWGAALDAFASKPVLGIGAGNYELWWNGHAPIRVVTLDAHSLYLETLAELGVVGLILLLGFLVFVIRTGIRRLNVDESPSAMRTEVAMTLALFAAALTSAALDWIWEIPAAFAPAIVAAALLTGSATERALAPASGPVPVEENGSRGRRRRGGQFGLGVATILCAWLVIWAAGDQLVAGVKLDDSRNAVDRGELDAAAQDARDAAAIQPWSPEPQLQLALVEKEGGDLTAAADAVRKAVDGASDDWRPWLVAAEINAADGRPRIAQFALERANELSPRPLRVVLKSAR